MPITSRIKKRYIGLGAFVLLTGLAAPFAVDKAIVYMAKRADVAGVRTLPPQTFGWIPYWDQPAAIASFKDNPERFNYIGLFWHALRSDGSIGQYPHAKIDTELITYAQQKGIKVIINIANLPTEDEGGDWDASRVRAVIKDNETRQKHIADIVALAQRYNVNGVQIDYEALSRKERANFTKFIRELSLALHAQGKSLGVSLHPKSGENNPRFSNGSQAQDWKQLARYADRLHLMLFEEHWETSKPGPAASLAWGTPIYTYAQKLIPADKLFVSIPLYGYDWGDPGKGAQGLTYADVKKLQAKYTAKTIWDAKAASQHFTYKESGQSHEVWFEDRQSVKAKLQSYKGAGLINFSFWRLGNEDRRVWELLP